MGREVARQSLNCILTVWAFFLLMLGVCVCGWSTLETSVGMRLVACGMHFDLWHCHCTFRYRVAPLPHLSVVVAVAIAIIARKCLQMQLKLLRYLVI